MIDSRKKKLLIVDDDPNLRLLYQLEFSESGYDVLLAPNGPEAIGLFENNRPDLVIMDIKMPGMDGIESMSRILGKNNSIPIIINSGYSNYRESYMSWAADAYILKSSNLDELKTKVRELMNMKKHDGWERPINRTSNILPYRHVSLPTVGKRVSHHQD